MKIEFYNDNYFDKWDEFIDLSYNGTFIHKRKFLSYHKNRFEDKSLMIYDENEKLVAVFPAAVDLNNSKSIVSHPGITYGGIVTNKLYGEDIIKLIKEICKIYKLSGYKTVEYKVVPHIYHRKYSQDDSYALFRLNSIRSRCDLSASIIIDENIRLRKGTQWMINKAKKSNLIIYEGKADLEEYWNILTYNLYERYNVKPTHSLEEINDLIDRFPKNIKCIVCKLEDKVLAGVILFNMNNVYHLQYISNTDEAKECGALEFLINHVIEICKKENKRVLDFGINNEKQGRYLNQSLYRFKKGFNSGGVVYETYMLDLKEVIDND